MLSINCIAKLITFLYKIGTEMGCHYFAVEQLTKGQFLRSIIPQTVKEKIELLSKLNLNLLCLVHNLAQ